MEVTSVEPASAEDGAAEDGAAAPPPSKRQAKRDARRQQQAEAWAAKKVAMKAKRKAARAGARREQQAEWETLTPEAQEERRRAAKSKHEARAAAAAAASAAAAELPPAPAVAIDLGFGELMSERDSTSLAQQVMYAYGANKRAARALELHLTSFGGHVRAHLERIGGFANWRVSVHERGYRDVFGTLNADAEPSADGADGAAAPRRVVYLSSESDVVLRELDPDAVYIIGGLVDHNHHKGLTHRLASEARVATARLPIDEHVQMAARRVLAVNHVFEILLHFANGASWEEAFLRAVPGRKFAATTGTASMVSAAAGAASSHAAGTAAPPTEAEDVRSACPRHNE